MLDPFSIPPLLVHPLPFTSMDPICTASSSWDPSHPPKERFQSPIGGNDPVQIWREPKPHLRECRCCTMKHVAHTWQKAWPWVLAFRMCNAWFVATYFDPDEFWQAPESAHAWLHPGTTQLPWEHRARIRSALHPMMLVAFAKLWPTNVPVMTSARMLHAGIACVADLAAVHLAEKHGGKRAARWTWCCSCPTGSCAMLDQDAMLMESKQLF